MEINDYLKGLGESSQEVADSLISEGIKGHRRCRFGCAIVEALKKNFDVGSWLSHVVGEISNTHVANVICPPAVKEFMRDFDSGKYPDLQNRDYTFLFIDP